MIILIITEGVNLSGDLAVGAKSMSLGAHGVSIIIQIFLFLVVDVVSMQCYCAMFILQCHKLYQVIMYIIW